tara:strand:+ start:931 stop:1146 length:216 start_codon:yes stop_codon:yes gene_type:complete
MDTFDAGDVATRGHNPAPTPANDDSLILQRGIIALFNRSIKSVAIDMCHAELYQFSVANKAWRFADRTAAL